MPILALTRRGDLKRKLEAFDQGVDDVLTVPFSPEELLARVVVITRRTYGVPRNRVGPRLGEIEIDIVNRQVIAGGSVLHLTALDRASSTCSRRMPAASSRASEILDAVWGPDFIAESNIVDRHIRSLRAKLQNDFASRATSIPFPGRLSIHPDRADARQPTNGTSSEPMPD